MASSHNKHTHSEAAKLEQIIAEFFSKSLHIILESRTLSTSSRNFSTVSSPSSTSSSSSSSIRSRDKWFNLALRECASSVLENADLWRHNNHEPIVVDIVLVQRPLQWDQNVNFSPIRVLPRSSSLKERFPWNTMDKEEFGVTQTEKIVERWVIHHENKKSKDSSSSNRRLMNSSLHNLYKKSTLLLRSLYSTVRLLPAYRIFRELNSSGKVCAFTLAHRVSTFVEPFTSKQESDMIKFGFTPVDSSSGRLSLSVMYRPLVSDVSSEPSTPLSPQVITDYVGSPMADQLRRFPSLPAVKLQLLGSSSPSAGSPFSRRHSWSYDHCRASSPSANYSASPSPSPTHSDSHTLVSNANSHCYPSSSLPPHPSEMSLLHKKNTNFEDNYPSPNFSPSPSPSPSPPIYNLGPKTLIRSESAPLSTLNAEVSNSPGHTNKHNLPPSTPIRISRCTSEIERSRNLMQSCTTAEKLFTVGKDGSQKHSGVKIAPSSLPQISFSRSSSRSYQDDFDDTDFTCPFDVDDDDMTDPSSRAESFDRGLMAEVLEAGRLFPIRKSQGAAVGALVHMLKKAAPLHQDFSACENSSQSQGTVHPHTCKSSNIQEPSQILETLRPASMMSSGTTTNRKTASDALEEFHSYRDMKNLLLMRSSSSK